MDKKVFNKIIASALAVVLTLSVIPGISPSSVAADGPTPTMIVDMVEELGGLLHGASGFLYGVSSEDVPTNSLITPLKSKVLATKGALGTEHPYADALDVAKTFLESGGEMVQMYNSNYYAIFQPKQTYQDYIVQLKEVIVPYVTEWKNKWKEEHNHNPETGLDDLGLNIDKAIVYLPINEGDSYRGTTNGNGLPWSTLDGFKGNSTMNGQDFRQVFDAYYKAIKEADPLATVGGINPAEYGWLHVPPQWGWDGWHTWLSYLYERDSMPDVVTWHQLERNEDRYEADIREFTHFRSIFAGEGNTGEPFGRVNNVNVDKIPADVPPIVINEIAQSNECGVPGALVSWIGRLEDAQVYGCLPFWHQANNLNDLAADANEPNGAWWLYKWYADMSGQRLQVNTENTNLTGLYGLSTIDNEKKIATTLFGLGDEDGDATVILQDLDRTEAFMGADKVNVKIDAAYFKGYNSVSFPETVLEGTFALEDGNLNIEMTDILRSTGYRLTVTPAAANDQIGNLSFSPFHGIYEAEEAIRVGTGNLGTVTSGKYFLSGPRVSEWTPSNNSLGGSGVNNFTNNRGIEYTIDVPEDGKYKLEFIYGNQVGMNRGNETQHRPTNQKQQLTIDGVATEMLLKNTMEREWTAIYTRYVDWQAGRHTIRIMGNGATQEGGIMQDALHVTHTGDYNAEIPAFHEVYEAEDANFAFNMLHPNVNLAKIETGTRGYTGKGYVTGLNEKSVAEGGGIRWEVVVEDSGLYNVDLRYQSAASGKVTIHIGNAARTFEGLKKDVEVVNTGAAWVSASVMMYLQKGINIIDADTTTNIALDSLSIRKSENVESYSQEVRAVDAIPSGAQLTNIKYDVWSARWNENYVDPVFAGLLNGAEPYATTREVNKTETTGLTPSGEEITYVVGRSLTGDPNAENNVDKYLEFEVEVPDAGSYALQIFHSNDEIYGTHGYNTKIIDKFANIKVNDQPAKRYFFINTISRDTFKEKSVYIDLEKGRNTIKIFNDDSWTVMKGLDDGQANTAGLPDWRVADLEENPSGSYSSYYFDKPGNIPIVNSLPNFSKFIITPATLDVVVPVTKVTLNQTKLSLAAVGAAGILEATILPINATNKNMTWTSSAPAVATVNNGVVTPLTVGTAKITAASSSNPAIKAECIVTVTAAVVTGVTLDKTMLKLEAGAKATLKATIAPASAANKNVTWTSSAPAVVKVSGGIVTAVAAGTAKITVMSDADNTKKAECTVTVTEKVLKKGDSFKPGNLTYKILTVDAIKKSGTVQVASAPSNKKLKTVNIPNTVSNAGITYKVVNIAANAFKNNKVVTSVKLGKNVKEVKSGAFSGCKNLKKVITGSALEKIGKSAFLNNKNLMTIDLKKSKKLTSVGRKTFRGVPKKATVKVPKGKVTAYRKILNKGNLAKSVKVRH